MKITKNLAILLGVAGLCTCCFEKNEVKSEPSVKEKASNTGGANGSQENNNQQLKAPTTVAGFVDFFNDIKAVATTKVNIHNDLPVNVNINNINSNFNIDAKYELGKDEFSIEDAKTGKKIFKLYNFQENITIDDIIVTDKSLALKGLQFNSLDNLKVPVNIVIPNGVSVQGAIGSTAKQYLNFTYNKFFCQIRAESAQNISNFSIEKKNESGDFLVHYIVNNVLKTEIVKNSKHIILKNEVNGTVTVS